MYFWGAFSSRNAKKICLYILDLFFIMTNYFAKNSSSWISGFSENVWFNMTQNLLRLNDNKTNIIYLASPHCVKFLKTPALQMGASSITSNGSVKNLGGTFDQYINVYEQVTSVCRAAYYHLRTSTVLKHSRYKKHL